MAVSQSTTDALDTAYAATSGVSKAGAGLATGAIKEVADATYYSTVKVGQGAGEGSYAALYGIGKGVGSIAQSTGEGAGAGVASLGTGVGKGISNAAIGAVPAALIVVGIVLALGLAINVSGVKV
jgi:hypothetical protein